MIPFLKNYFPFHIYIYASRDVWRDGYPNVSNGNFWVEFFFRLYGWKRKSILKFEQKKKKEKPFVKQHHNSHQVLLKHSYPLT